MATIATLNTSISAMSFEEAEKLIRAIRTSRSIPKKTTKKKNGNATRSAAPRAKKNPLDVLKALPKDELLKLLQGEN